MRRALEAIDAANAGDPNRIRVRGVERPKEQAHAELVTGWIERLAPNASEALRLAGRAHHVRRWEIPRSSYPEGRLGYLRWRADLQDHHDAVLAVILEEAGYGREIALRCGDLLHKKGLGRDPEVQTLEDALCLVFLETQLGDIAARLDADKLVDVARKTLRKMSDRAIEEAGRLPLEPEARDLLERALGRPLH